MQPRLRTTALQVSRERENFFVISGLGEIERIMWENKGECEREKQKERDRKSTVYFSVYSVIFMFYGLTG